MNHSVLPWLQDTWLDLCRYREQERVPQALLITGPSGLGKRLLADQFASALLCTKPQANGLSCGHCPSCKLIEAGNHPDLSRIEVTEPGKDISVATIRSIIVNIALKPQYEQYRIVIVDPADCMNRSAANAFLKSLEEPGERTLFLLISAQPTKLPATILSRCQKLAIPPPSRNETIAWLRQQNIDGDPAILAAMAQNAPLAARRYANGAYLTQRQECLNTWLAVSQGRADPITVAESWTKLPQTELLFWLTSWTIDQIKCFFQIHPNHLQHPEQLNVLQEQARKLDLDGLYKLYDLLLASRRWLQTQINKQLLFEEILMLWSQLAGRK